MLYIPNLDNLFFISSLDGMVSRNYNHWPRDLYGWFNERGNLFAIFRNETDEYNFSVITSKNVDAMLFYYKGKIVVDTNRD